MKKTIHSKLPWKLNGLDIADCDGYFVIDKAGFMSYNNDVNFILRAVNSHYQMLSALKVARRLLNKENHSLRFIDTAIASAKGKL